MEEMFDPQVALKLGVAAGFVLGWFITYTASFMYDLVEVIRNKRKEDKKNASSNSSVDDRQ